MLSLRLLDHLLEQNLITNSYILKKNTQRQQMLQLPDQQAYCPFRDDVQIPLLMAVLLQDVGHYHPDAMRLLQADGSQPNYRLQFSNTERQEFVEISLQASVRFLLKGIGMPVYRGNSKSERAEYQQNEQEKWHSLLQYCALPLRPVPVLAIYCVFHRFMRLQCCRAAPVLFMNHCLKSP